MLVLRRREVAVIVAALSLCDPDRVELHYRLSLANLSHRGRHAHSNQKLFLWVDCFLDLLSLPVGTIWVFPERGELPRDIFIVYDVVSCRAMHLVFIFHQMIEPSRLDRRQLLPLAAAKRNACRVREKWSKELGRLGWFATLAFFLEILAFGFGRIGNSDLEVLHEHTWPAWRDEGDWEY